MEQHNPSFAPFQDGLETLQLASDVAEDAIEGSLTGRVNEQSIDGERVVVTRSAMYRPIVRQMLVSPENLFDDEIVLRVPEGGELASQPAQIAARIVEAVRMVDAKTLDLSFGDQLEQAAMGRVEHCIVLGAQAGEIIDVEEPPVVDLIGCHAPVREPVRLALE